jgi:hypothetical protein
MLYILLADDERVVTNVFQQIIILGSPSMSVKPQDP